MLLLDSERAWNRSLEPIAGRHRIVLILSLEAATTITRKMTRKEKEMGRCGHNTLRAHATLLLKHLHLPIRDEIVSGLTCDRGRGRKLNEGFETLLTGHANVICMCRVELSSDKLGQLNPTQCKPYRPTLSSPWMKYSADEKQPAPNAERL